MLIKCFLSKHNRNNYCQFKFTLESYNLDNGSSIKSNGSLYFSDDKTLKDVLKFFNKRFNINDIHPEYYGCFIDNIDSLWKQHGFIDTYAIETNLLNYKLKDLSEMFEIKKFIFHIVIGGGIGNGYGEDDGFKYIIHANETKQHHRRHIHVIRAGEDISIDLDNLEVISGAFKRSKDIRKAIRDVERNQEGLIREWENLQNDKIKSDFEMHFD